MALDGDTTLTLQVHIIKDLVLHLFGTHCFGELKQSIGKCALAMVDVSYYAKVSYILHVFWEISF